MHSHTLPGYQYVERSYRVVVVHRDGERRTISHHDSFLAAERSRRMIGSQEDAEVRIETAPEARAASRVG